MYSYNTTIAIQLLNVMQGSKDCPMNVTEMNQRAGLSNVGYNVTGKVIRSLYKLCLLYTSPSPRDTR